MYKFHSWWFPDEDTHFAAMMKKHMDRGGQDVYQHVARQASIESCANRTLALDIGANVGLWTRDLCEAFQTVMAFEPVAQFRDCLRKNVSSPNLEIVPLALGDVCTTVDMVVTAENTGHSHVDVDSLGKGSTSMVTLDSLDLPKVDYVKIDCEGFENKILQGAKHTLLRYRPVLVIEDKKHRDVGHDDIDTALDTLLGWGAKVIKTINNDHVMAW